MKTYKFDHNVLENARHQVSVVVAHLPNASERHFHLTGLFGYPLRQWRDVILILGKGETAGADKVYMWNVNHLALALQKTSSKGKVNAFTLGDVAEDELGETAPGLVEVFEHLFFLL